MRVVTGTRVCLCVVGGEKSVSATSWSPQCWRARAKYRALCTPARTSEKSVPSNEQDQYQLEFSECLPGRSPRSYFSTNLSMTSSCDNFSEACFTCPSAPTPNSCPPFPTDFGENSLPLPLLDTKVSHRRLLVLLARTHIAWGDTGRAC